MGQCLDVDGCGFHNREQARFCAQCGIPLRGAFLQGRYEVQSILNKERGTVTLQALDRHGDFPVTVRALIPKDTTSKERENFLQDAEWACIVTSGFWTFWHAVGN